MFRSPVTLLALSLVAMPALAKHVYPQHLDVVQDGATYSLAENYVFKEKAATFTLFAGDYVQAFEDRKAVYLLGGSDCLEMSVVPPKNPAAAWADKWDCGIYLPKDPTKGAAFFMIRRTPQQPHSGNGWLIDEMIKSGYGSFDFPTSNKDQPELRARLQRK